MQCLDCKSTHIRKNGIKKDKQNHSRAQCCHQFIELLNNMKRPKVIQQSLLGKSVGKLLPEAYTADCVILHGI